MREIKFRGLDIKGNWYYGLLAHTESKYMACGDTGWFISNKGGAPFAYQIRPETRGEYTGLKDKNGVEVYEGDIVTCSSGCTHEVVWKQELGGKYIGGMPGWYLSDLLSGGGEGYAWTGTEEVIGNIYENPELLSSKEEQP